MNHLLHKSYLPAAIFAAIGMGLFWLAPETLQRYLQFPKVVFILVFVIMFVWANWPDAVSQGSSADFGLWSAKTALSTLCFVLVLATTWMMPYFSHLLVLKLMLMCLQIFLLCFYIFFVVFYKSDAVAHGA